MKRTAFVCLGSGPREDSLHYQELPAKENGEEFFIFFAPGREDRKPLIKQLFRDAISAPRMGHPLKYFLGFIDRLNTVAGGIDDVENLVADSIIAIMIRRKREVYLFHNAGIEVVHWDGASVAKSPASTIPGFADMPLRRIEGQGDLFTRYTEELFVLRHFSLVDGSHTIVLAPSHDFVIRNSEALRNSIFFPAFELAPDVDVHVEIERSFPAIHWNTTGAETVKESTKTQRGLLRKISIPATVGVLTALVAVILFFGPWSRKDAVDGNSKTSPLLSADDTGQAELRTEAVEATPVSEAEGSPGPAGKDISSAMVLSRAWSTEFTAPVTSSPQFHGGTVYFGCRDAHLYAFAPNGTMKWKYDSGEGVGASPCCISRYVIGANYDGAVFCLDADSGRKLWSFAAKERIISTPQARGDAVLIGTMGGNLIALSLSDGAERWSQKIGAGIWANTYMGDTYIIAATTDGSLVRLNHDGKIEWRVKPGGGILSSPLCLEDIDLVVFGTKDTYIYAYSLSEGNLMWRAAAGGEVNGTAVSNGETILIGSDDGNAYALSMTGQIRWKTHLGGAVKSKPLIIGATVLITSYGSKIYALDLGSGEITSEHQTDAPVYSSPTHDGAKVYFGSNGGTFHALWMYGGAS
jgi:outer membrane protein assembly factor BamB